MKTNKIILASTCFLMLCASIANAGEKRFCGYIATGAPNSSGSTSNYGSGVYYKSSDSGYNTKCDETTDEVKSALKKEGLWDATGFDWVRKEGYKCDSISDYFTGSTNMCKEYMKKGEPYFIEKADGESATFTKK